MLAIPLLCALLSPLAAARAGGNTMVYTGGLIYVKAGVAPAEAAVVENGRFSYVGNLEGALRMAGQDAKHVDLKGRMMLPSFFEAHAHPSLNTLLNLRDLPYAGEVAAPGEYVAYIRQYLEVHAGTQALRGAGWDNASFPGAPPNKALLDQVSTEIPIYIRSFDQHSAWVNSKALEMCNISRDTPDPLGGLIERDETGEPCGTLRDAAVVLVETTLPPISVAEYKELILAYQEAAHSLGFTGHMNALVLPRDNVYAAYRELLAEGKLSMYTQLAFLVTPDTYADAIVWAANEAAAYEAEERSDLLGFRLAKFLMDGVFLGETAYLLEDYAMRPGYRGNPSWPADGAALRDAFRLCDESGLRIHIHAVGDAATRFALDALETVNTANKPAITHVELVAPEDIARFGNLGVIAVINPYWFCKSAVWEDSEQKSLGVARSDRMFPAKSFYDAGAQVTAASDYPVTGYPNPLGGIEMAVTRTLMASLRGDRTAEECTQNLTEAISVEQALDAFTFAAAWSYDLDAVTGSMLNLGGYAAEKLGHCFKIVRADYSFVVHVDAQGVIPLAVADHVRLFRTHIHRQNDFLAADVDSVFDLVIFNHPLFFAHIRQLNSLPIVFDYVKTATFLCDAFCSLRRSRPQE